MAWSDRHAHMLKAMGLRQWVTPALAGTAPVVADDSYQQVTAKTQPVTLEERSRPMMHQPASEPTWSPLAADVAKLDWPHLRQAVAQCRACGLCEGRTQTVFGAGHARAHWLVIGDAPSADEDAQGEPFVGASGQLLDQMLSAIGLARSGDNDPSKSVYIANTVKCRPPGNRNPSVEEMAQCAPFLLRQIELLQPRMILAMGRFAVQALLRSSEPIGRLRGRLHSFQGVPMVVTYHPAYLLRNLNEKAKAWEDLCLSADRLANNR